MKTTRIILLTAVLAISLVLVLGVRLNRATEDETVTHFGQRQLLLIEQTVAGIQTIFNGAQQYLLHFKDAPGPTHLADALATEDEEKTATWRRVTEEGFSSCLRSHPTFTQIRYIDASGQEIVRVDRDGEDVHIIPQDQLLSQAERDFFIAAQQLNEREIYISRLEPALGHGGVRAGALTLRLTTPVFDNQGRRAGIVVLNLLSEEIRTRVGRLSIEESVDVWLLDETGVDLINVTHPELEGRNTYEYLRQTGDETLVALAEELLAGGRGTAIYLWPESVGEAPAVKKLVAYTPLYPAEGQVWSVGVSVPYETILATHRQTRDTLIVLGGGIIAVILAGAFLIIRAERRRVEAEEQARFSELLYRWNMQLQTATQVSRAASSILDMDRLIQQSVELIQERFGLYYAGLFLVNETGEWAMLRAGSDEAGRRMVEQGHKLEVGGNSMIGWCVAHKQARIALDVGAEAVRFANPLLPETRSEMALPLISRGKALGALTIQSTEEAAFSTEDIATLQTMGDQLTSALEGARLYEQAQQEIAERRRAEGLIRVQHDLGWALSAAHGLDETLRLCVETAIHVSGMDCGGIYLVDETSGDVDLAFHKDLPSDFIKNATHYAADSDNARLVRAGKPLYARHQELGLSLDATSRQENLRAVAIIPVLYEDRVIACLNIASHILDAVPDFARTVLETIAAQIGNAIARQKAEESLQESEEKYRDLVENINDVIYAVDASGVITYISPVAESLSGYSSSELIGRSFTKLIHPEDLPDLMQVVQGISLDHLEPYEYRIVTKSGAIRWVCSFSRQILDGEHVIGARGVLTDVTARKQAEEEIKRRNRQLAALHKADLAIASNLDLNTVLTQVLTEVQSLLNAEAASVLLPDSTGNELIFAAVVGIGSEVLRGTRILAGAGIAGWVMREAQPVLTTDAQNDPRFYANIDVITGLATRSLLAVPLLCKGKTLGVVEVINRENEGFNEHDLDLLSTLAGSAAIAIENARLYQEIQCHVDELHHAPPDLAGYHCTAGSADPPAQHHRTSYPPHRRDEGWIISLSY